MYVPRHTLHLNSHFLRQTLIYTISPTDNPAPAAIASPTDNHAPAASDWRLAIGDWRLAGGSSPVSPPWVASLEERNELSGGLLGLRCPSFAGQALRPRLRADLRRRMATVMATAMDTPLKARRNTTMCTWSSTMCGAGPSSHLHQVEPASNCAMPLRRR